MRRKKRGLPRALRSLSLFARSELRCGVFRWNHDCTFVTWQGACPSTVHSTAYGMASVFRVSSRGRFCNLRIRPRKIHKIPYGTHSNLLYFNSRVRIWRSEEQNPILTDVNRTHWVSSPSQRIRAVARVLRCRIGAVCRTFSRVVVFRAMTRARVLPADLQARRAHEVLLQGLEAVDQELQPPARHAKW